MSFKCMALAAEAETGSPTRKLILLMLADRSNESGLCYPSQNRLAKDCELSRDTIIRQIKELEKIGFLTVIHRSKDGVKLPNHYQLHLQGVVAQNDNGSSTERHKPIKEPINASNQDLEAFEKLWKDYTLTFLKRKNRGGGSKAKAKANYLKLASKYSSDEIYDFVEDHAGLEIGHKDLERLLRIENIRQWHEDRIQEIA